MAAQTNEPGAGRRWLPRAILAVGLLGIFAVFALLRTAVATDYLYHSVVKDPERVAPGGPVMVAPADGTVLYVREVKDGVIPEVIKHGVSVPVVDLLRVDGEPRFRDGWLVGIYMNTFGVHINRIPNHGKIVEQDVYNGPHMDMTEFERRLILTEMVPGLVSIRRMLGLTAHPTEDVSDFILQSARETLVLEDERGADVYIVRIADYYVGKILTWVGVDEAVERGQRLGMISWGSQTDLFIEATPGLVIEAQVGDYVYAGETVIATYEDR
jgi:phosphatidylserine decarboxylase